MGIFDLMEKYGHEKVYFFQDKAAGLKAIVGIHDTTLGPALGGCRMWDYQSEEEALLDVLRLSRGMTYKCAVSNTMFGGGKSVIIGNPLTEKSDELFQAFGTFIETMKGSFYTGTDVGTVGMDFVSAAKQSKYFVGLPEEYGGSGNSAIITAYGVWQGMKATAKEVFGTDQLKGLTIAVQGLGKVGAKLVEHLLDDGAIVYATDINQANIENIQSKFPQVTIVEPKDIYNIPCDIYSPNALGGVINDETIQQLKCKAIAGAANNVLKENYHGDKLHQMGILYAPDYVINAGGLIQVADELNGYNKERAFRNASLIYQTLEQIYKISKEEDIPTYLAADRMVERKIEKLVSIQSKFSGIDPK